MVLAMMCEPLEKGNQEKHPTLSKCKYEMLRIGKALLPVLSNLTDFCPIDVKVPMFPTWRVEVLNSAEAGCCIQHTQDCSH